MIKNIFFDIDETLIHSFYEKPHENLGDYITLKFTEGSDLYTIIRPCSKELVKFARDLVGSERVFILTTSIREYAEQVNAGAGWGFRNDQIFTREDLREKNSTPHPVLADPNNVIIDNLPPRYNDSKMTFIGIRPSRYMQIQDYYGVNHPEAEEDFVTEVKEFLTTMNDGKI